MGQFITPDNLPTDTFCRQILIPNDPKWIGTVSGALLPLMHASEWKEVEGITAEEAADRAKIMLYEFWASDCCGEDCMNCCEDRVILHRFNPVTGRPEVSSDDGTTWTTDPADVQNLIPLYPPLVSEGGKTKCDAATNASEHINELIAATSTNLETAGTVFELAVAIAGAVLALFLIIVSAGVLTAPVTAVVTAIWAAGTAVFELGKAAFDTYWTVDKQDAILCALYCAIGEDGQFTEAQYQVFRADIKDTLPASPAFDIIMTAINAGGARGLSQMASYGNAAEADCASCSCVDAVVYYYDSEGVWQPWFPDELGVYDSSTITQPVSGSDYYLTFGFNSVFNVAGGAPFTPCNNISIVTVTGSAGFVWDCNTGTNNFLSTCWAYSQYVRSGTPVQITFTLVNDVSCTEE